MYDFFVFFGYVGILNIYFRSIGIWYYDDVFFDDFIYSKGYCQGNNYNEVFYCELEILFIYLVGQ